VKFIDPRDKPRDPWHTIDGDDGPMVTLTPNPFSLLTLAQQITDANAAFARPACCAA